MKPAPLVLAAIAALALSACSGPADAPAAAPEPSSASPTTESATMPATATSEPTEAADPQESSMIPGKGDYEFQTGYGVVGTFTLPGKPNATVERMRKMVGEKPIKYIDVKIDNRNGEQPANMYQLAFFDAAGKKYDIAHATEPIEVWRERYASTETPDLYNEFVAATNSMVESVDVGEVNTISFAYTGELPDEFARIAVKAHGDSDTTEAYVAGSMMGGD